MERFSSWIGRININSFLFCLKYAILVSFTSITQSLTKTNLLNQISFSIFQFILCYGHCQQAEVIYSTSISSDAFYSLSLLVSLSPHVQIYNNSNFSTICHLVIRFFFQFYKMYFKIKSVVFYHFFSSFLHGFCFVWSGVSPIKLDVSLAKIFLLLLILKLQQY